MKQVVNIVPYLIVAAVAVFAVIRLWLRNKSGRRGGIRRTGGNSGSGKPGGPGNGS
jgi:hypothetical protein